MASSATSSFAVMNAEGIVGKKAPKFSSLDFCFGPKTGRTVAREKSLPRSFDEVDIGVALAVGLSLDDSK